MERLLMLVVVRSSCSVDLKPEVWSVLHTILLHTIHMNPNFWRHTAWVLMEICWQALGGCEMIAGRPLAAVR